MTSFRHIAVQCLKDEANAIFSLIEQLDDSFDKAIYGYIYAKSYKEVRSKLNIAKVTLNSFNSHKSSPLFADWCEKYPIIRRFGCHNRKRCCNCN